MKYVLMMLLSNITIHLYSQAAFTTQVYDYNHLIDRYEILSGSLSEKVFSGFKPYRRDHILDFITSHVQDSLMADTSGLSKRDLFNFSYINDDNWDLQYGKGNSTKP
ncbi:MAG TPA: hypothetical protein VL947_10395, partial [Cytophagales bacterium]|nr:hypothetical protein [Cytophagales bacterium]